MELEARCSSDGGLKVPGRGLEGLAMWARACCCCEVVWATVEAVGRWWITHSDGGAGKPVLCMLGSVKSVQNVHSYITAVNVHSYVTAVNDRVSGTLMEVQANRCCAHKPVLCTPGSVESAHIHINLAKYTWMVAEVQANQHLHAWVHGV